jgi:hypothetical protein
MGAKPFSNLNEPPHGVTPQLECDFIHKINRPSSVSQLPFNPFL